MITLKQAQAIYTALTALQDAGITGTQVRVVNNGTTSTVWVDEGTVYLLAEFSTGDESEHEFSSLDDFLNSSR